MGRPHHVECERADTRKCPPQLSAVITVLRLRRGQMIPQRSHAVSARLRRRLLASYSAGLVAVPSMKTLGDMVDDIATFLM